MQRIDLGHRLGRFHGFDVEIDDHRLLPASHEDTLELAAIVMVAATYHSGPHWLTSLSQLLLPVTTH